MQFACLRKIARDSARAPRLQHAGVVSLGQHKDGTRAATINSVLKQRASALGMIFHDTAFVGRLSMSQWR
jgi:hypothetical protein